MNSKTIHEDQIEPTSRRARSWADRLMRTGHARNRRMRHLLQEPTPSRWQCLFLAGWLLAITVASYAAPSAKDSAQPTLDDLLNIPKSYRLPAADSSSTPAKPKRVEDSSGPTTSQGPSSSEVTAELHSAVQVMNRVVTRLGPELDPGLETQRLEESILAKLDRVIEIVSRQQTAAGEASTDRSRSGAE